MFFQKSTKMLIFESGCFFVDIDRVTIVCYNKTEDEQNRP